MRDRNFITSLERGLAILQGFGELSRPLTLTEVAKICNLNKTATQRFLHTLCSLGYLHKDENKSYVLGTKVLSLGFTYFNSTNLVKIVRPYLEELSLEFNKTVNLAVLDGTDQLILFRKEVATFLKFDIGPGAKTPAHAGSLGKVLLAGLPDEEFKKRIHKITLHPLTPRTITSKEMLWAEILKIRKQGYSTSSQELSMDLVSFAVPLNDSKGDVAAAINFSSKVETTSTKELNGILLELKKKGEAISRSLGFAGAYPSFPE